MELAARRFARWVLVVHLLLLVGILALVFLAAREAYEGARMQAIQQAASRQSLLAEQTARGIESYYTSLIDNFELLRRTEEEGQNTPDPPSSRRGGEIARLLLAPALWQQVRNRASHFLVVDRSTMRAPLILPESEADVGPAIFAKAGAWLRSVRSPAVSKPLAVDGESVNLVCVPVSSEGHRLFVAVVPLKLIAHQFLDAVNDQKYMSALLLDEEMRVMAAYDQRLVGLSLADDSSDVQVRKLAENYRKIGKAGIEVIESNFSLGSYTFDGGIVSAHPIELRGKRWWLTIGASFAEVNSVVHSTFRGALLWAIFVVVSMTAILVSTSIQMIRSRVRLERIRHELLERELSQARQIQLAWLPRNDDDPAHIDLSAINIPASHISGDFYNWFDLPGGRTCVVIGDVTGHGMAAAFLMATTQLLVRMIMPRVLEPGRCLEEVNRQLCQQVFSGQFVTMEILIIDRENGRLEVSSAGHLPPLLGSGPTFAPIKLDSQLVLGVEPEVSYTTVSVDLPDAACLVLYTDGVIEAQSPEGRQFGMAGLCAALEGSFQNAEQVADRVISAIERFRQQVQLRDDLTLVTIQLEPVTDPKESMAAAI